jgi:hypothetical protein
MSNSILQSQQSTSLRLDCTACKTQASMEKAKVGKFSNIVRVIGGILLIPSFLGFIFTLLLFTSILMTASELPEAASDAELAGRTIGSGIGIFFTLIVGVISLIGGLLGWLLLLNRNVWKCLRCESISDRA